MQAIAIGHGLTSRTGRSAPQRKAKLKHGGLPMLVKITIALALILGSASGALAATKQKHNANRADDWQAYDLYYGTRGQHSGSVARAKSAHAKTAPVKTVRIEATQIEAKQVEATQLEVRQVEARQAEARQAEATQVEATQVEATQVEATQVEATQVEATQVEATQVEATQVEATQVVASQVVACQAEAVQAKTKHAKAKHVKAKHVQAKQAPTKHAQAKHTKAKHAKARQKRHTKQAYATFDPFYNVRSQYAGPASRAQATPRSRHGGNPANDVYDTRGWYIGSDPDATVRAMMSMDPTGSD
jgi:hypothetical protein